MSGCLRRWRMLGTGVAYCHPVPVPLGLGSRAAQPALRSRRSNSLVTPAVVPSQLSPEDACRRSQSSKADQWLFPARSSPHRPPWFLSMCLHVSCAAAWLCAARERRRSRHANSCGGQSSMPALERRHRTLLKLRRQAQESAAMGSSYLQQTDSLPQSTTPIIVPRRLTVYRSLPQSIW